MKKFLFILALLLLSSCTVQKSECVSQKLQDETLKNIVENNGFNPGTILITLQDGAGKENLTALIAPYNLTVKHDYPSLNIMALNVPPGEELDWICKLESSEMVKRGELDVLLKTQV